MGCTGVGHAAGICADCEAGLNQTIVNRGFLRPVCLCLFGNGSSRKASAALPAIHILQLDLIFSNNKYGFVNSSSFTVGILTYMSGLQSARECARYAMVVLYISSRVVIV